MYTNCLYENSMALIFRNSKIIGWMSTDKEADVYCEKHHDCSWDFYKDHKDYVDLTELPFMTMYS